MAGVDVSGPFASHEFALKIENAGAVLIQNPAVFHYFLSKNFDLPEIENEIPSDTEIKSSKELEVGIPKDNLTMLRLAQKLGRQISRPPIPSDHTAQASWAAAVRDKLKAIIRFKPGGISRAWTVASTRSEGVGTESYLFEMNNGLSADGVWVKAISTPVPAPATIVLND
jgi:hypothetical protein